MNKVDELYSVADFVARARVAGNPVRVQGNIDDLLAPRGLTLGLEVRAESLANLSPLVDTELPTVGPVQGSATLR